MKNTMEKILWGIILVLLGIFLGGKALGVFEFTLFFRGWWTLFIIVPSVVSLIAGNNIASSISGLLLGIMLLMTQTGAIGWSDFVKLLIALLFVKLGLTLLFPKKKNKENQDKNWKKNHNTNDANYYNKDSKYYDSDRNKMDDTSNKKEDTSYQKEDISYKKEYTQNNHDKNGNESYVEWQNSNETIEWNSPDSATQNRSDSWSSSNSNTQDSYSQNNSTQTQSSRAQYRPEDNKFSQYSGIFSVKKDQYVDEIFTGAVVNAILGGVELDLRNAIFLSDTIIDITCIMGGVDIFVPSNIKVVVNCTPIMGGVDYRVKNYNNQSQYTLVIKGSCFMGGVEIK